eukprot:TRINITY_DN33165_c1_g1_i1.p1 TRINITY_DN33165_c1_g1~~TRINITY_DN33165_c1_g1_i1.p1  ORF type:complete len:267 (+),score=43.73 TRINITY_DN33165_c1_g1_i1:88-888(+)
MSECARCHVDYYHNSEVKVYFSAVCDHKVCERCLPRLFRDLTCPGCAKPIRAEDFSQQPKDAREVDAEIRIRRRIRDIYCKTEQDFASAEEWNDYLMMREDIIYKLASPSSLEESQETERLIEQYREENAEQIMRAELGGNKKKLQKLAGIIGEEGSFSSQVNTEWHDRSKVLDHPFQAVYNDLLTQIPKSPTVPAAGASTAHNASPIDSPLIPPQALLGEHATGGKKRQMSGGGQLPESSVKKARHFFFMDLAVAVKPLRLTSCH